MTPPTQMAMSLGPSGAFKTETSQATGAVNSANHRCDDGHVLGGCDDGHVLADSLRTVTRTHATGTHASMSATAPATAPGPHRQPPAPPPAAQARGDSALTRTGGHDAAKTAFASPGAAAGKWNAPQQLEFTPLRKWTAARLHSGGAADHSGTMSLDSL